MVKIFLTLLPFLTLPFVAKAECKSEKMTFVGGVDGFSDLASAVNSTRFRSGKDVGLYIHAYAWDRASDNLRKDVLKTFEHSGNFLFEGNESGHPEQYWRDVFGRRMPPLLGAIINTQSPTASALSLDKWKIFVDAAKKNNVGFVAPVFTPNDGSWKTRDFGDQLWNEARERAKFGGGIAIDSPPWYYNSHSDQYKRFISSEVLWAKKAGLCTILIISPPRSNEEGFTNGVKIMLDDFNARRVVFNIFVFENYMSSPPRDFIHNIGRDSDPETILGTAAALQNSLFSH